MVTVGDSAEIHCTLEMSLQSILQPPPPHPVSALKNGVSWFELLGRKVSELGLSLHKKCITGKGV
jgi:hypothetical protein